MAIGGSLVVSTPPAMPHVDLSERDLVRDEHGRLDAGVARLLHVVGGRGRAERAPEHALAGQIEVAAVLEHRAGDDLAERLVLKVEAGDETVERRGEHVRVARLGVRSVGAGEGDAVAADDRRLAGARAHGFLPREGRAREDTDRRLHHRSRVGYNFCSNPCRATLEGSLSLDDRSLSAVHPDAARPAARRAASVCRVPSPCAASSPATPVLAGPVALGAAPGGRLLAPTAAVLAALDADARVLAHGPAQTAADDGGLSTTLWDPRRRRASRVSARSSSTPRASARPTAEGGVLLPSPDHPPARCQRAPARPRDDAARLRMASASGLAQRSLEGFVRSAAKELGSGATGQLVYVAPAARASSSRRCASCSPAGPPTSTGRSCASDRRRAARAPSAPRRRSTGSSRSPGRSALVTGASRGIGEAIAQTLARDGAHVVCLDVPAQGEALAAVANAIGGSTLAAGHHRRRRPGRDRRASARAPRRRGRGRPQRRRHP